MVNPYQNVDWSNVRPVISTNHWHCTTLERFWAIYNTGMEHFALTNYQPAHPTYPLTDQPFFDLSEEELPSDIIQSPNTEQVRMLGGNFHFGTMGSFYATPGHNWDEDVDGEYPTWQDHFDGTLENMQYEDGGGIIINHPNRLTRTRNINFVIEMLKYDPRVLGVEVINHRSQRDYNSRGYYLNEWDDILSRGIRCFGFGSTDEHGLPDGYEEGEDMRNYNYGLGRNILLADSFDEHAALRAYRNGETYVAFFGDRIRFTEIKKDGDKFIVKTDDAVRIDFHSHSIVDGRVVKNNVETVLDNEAVFNINDKHIYVRSVAFEKDESLPYVQPIEYEKIYTQPIMLKTEEEVQKAVSMGGGKSKNKLLLLS